MASPPCAVRGGKPASAIIGHTDRPDAADLDRGCGASGIPGKGLDEIGSHLAFQNSAGAHLAPPSQR
ncbi:MAG: hypothetical protein ACREH3_10700 [Geminicoccales bacterium]